MLHQDTLIPELSTVEDHTLSCTFTIYHQLATIKKVDIYLHFMALGITMDTDGISTITKVTTMLILQTRFMSHPEVVVLLAPLWV